MIKVLVIDDSKLIRSLLREIIEQDPSLTVCGVAEDPYQARDMIKKLLPDVLTLDIEMPKMNGIQFLKNLMRLRPMPVLMISTLTEKNASVTLEALSLGAIDFVTKPKFNIQSQLMQLASEIQSKVKIAASAMTMKQKLQKIQHEKTSCLFNQQQTKPLQSAIVAIGASTGGTEAISFVLNQISFACPPVVITQHIPGSFSQAFADRLDNESLLSVCHASHNQILTPGKVYISPGDQHLTVIKKSNGHLIELNDDPPVNGHRPSVEVMFDSLLPLATNTKILLIILTGMGIDGASAMQRMQVAGAETIAQDEKTSVVWGMPGAAVKLNAVNTVLSLQQIPLKIKSWVERLK